MRKSGPARRNDALLIAQIHGAPPHGEPGSEPCHCGDDDERHHLLHGLDCLRIGRPDLLWDDDCTAIMNAMQLHLPLDPSPF